MPIAAGMGTLQNAFAQALAKDGANPDKSAAIIASGLSSAIPMGLYIAVPPSATPYPLPPSGVSSAKSMIAQSLKLKNSAKPAIVGKMMAMGISMACPIVPPVGMSALASVIENALNIKQGATPQMVGAMIAQGVIAYYSGSGVVA